jgi:hypothetical protein
MTKTGQKPQIVEGRKIMVQILRSTANLIKCSANCVLYIYIYVCTHIHTFIRMSDGISFALSGKRGLSLDLRREDISRLVTLTRQMPKMHTVVESTFARVLCIRVFTISLADYSVYKYLAVQCFDRECPTIWKCENWWSVRYNRSTTW